MKRYKFTQKGQQNAKKMAMANVFTPQFFFVKTSITS